LSEVHEQQCAQHRRISTSRSKTPLFGIAIPANFHQLSGFDSDLGRVVITHSTYVEGLIPWLKSLACEKGIQTITPAVINRVRGGAHPFNYVYPPQFAAGTNWLPEKGAASKKFSSSPNWSNHNFKRLLNAIALRRSTHQQEPERKG
jgi:hypothetical protein